MIYANSTPKFLISIKDASDVVIDPNDANVIQIRIIIQNATNDKVLTRQYFKGTSPGATWDATRTARKLDDDDVPYLLFSLSKTETLGATGNKNRIQIEVDVTDTDIPTTNKRTIIKKGDFPQILPSAQ